MALALRRRGAAAQADARARCLWDDSEGGGARQPFYGRPRREPSVRWSNRVLGPTASSDGRRAVAVTAAGGGRWLVPDQGWTVFHLPSTLGSFQPSDRKLAAGSERRRSGWCDAWA